MQELAFIGTLYALGFVGLAGLTTIWFRIWQLTARGGFVRLWNGGTVGRVTGLVVFAAASYAVTLWWFAISRVLKCLTKPPCGPNMSSGWIALAIFGPVYLIFEATLFVSRLTVPGKKRL